MKYLAVVAFALVLASCIATIESRIFSALDRVRNEVCQQPETYRVLLRTKIQQRYGIDTTPLCGQR